MHRFAVLFLIACNGGTADDTSGEGTQRAPFADAGPDQSVDRLAAVTLDGSDSSDPDDDALSWSWTQVEGDAVALAEPQTATPMFVAPDAPGTLVFEVEVSDGELTATDTVSVAVTNRAPVADAGPDQSVDREVLVTLDASASDDPDSDSLTYAWTQTAGPSVTLSDDTAAQPTLTTPDAAGVLRFSLVVDDGFDASAADTVDVAIDNEAPVASAGLDQSVDKGQLVTLSAAGSTDGDGDDLTAAWSQTAGTAVVLSDDTATQPTFTAPGTSGTMTFEVVVSDGFDDSTPDSMDVTVVNRLPFADAGDDQTVGRGVFVTLDGSDSFDLDPTDTLTYAWTQTAGGTVTLSDATAIQPTFTAPVTDDTLGFGLVVHDGEEASMVGSVVTISVQNLLPIADAGADQNVPRDTFVTLDGSGSFDPDGAGVTSYAWTQVAGPLDVTLSDDSAEQPTFTTPDALGGTFVFELVVNDGEADSIPDRTRVITPSAPPVADAGIDGSYNGGEVVFLDGRASYDPEGGPISYEWVQTSGTPVDMGDGDGPRAYFAVPEGADEVLAFTLTVGDGQSQDSDDVEITAMAWSGAPVVLPANPWAITWFPAPNDTWSLSAVGDRMVVSGNDLGGDDLLLFDLSDPFAPALLDSVEPAYNNEVFLHGDTVYLDADGALDVYSIAGDTFTYQTTMDLTGDWETPYDFAVDGDLMFVTVYDGVASERGILALDISTPTAPTVLLDHVVSATAVATRPGELWVHGISTLTGFDTTGVGGPPNLLVQLTDASDPACGFVSRNMTIVGDALLTACDNSGLVVFDIADPLEPEVVASVSAPGAAQRLGVLDDVAYVTAGDAGLHEFDVTDPMSPVLLGTHTTSGNTENLVVTDGAIYARVGGDHVEILTPGVSAPEYAVDYAGAAFGWNVSYDAGYVALGHGGDTELIDVSDPDNPVRASLLGHGGQGDAFLAWPWLFAAGGQGLAIADVVVPDDPLIVHTVTGGESYEQVWLEGDMLFATQRTDGVKVFDVSNRNQPELLDTFGEGINFRTVRARGQVCYAAALGDQLYSLDVSDPTDVVELDAVSFNSPTGPLEMSGSYLYNGYGAVDFARFEVSDPSNIDGPDYFSIGIGEPVDIEVNGALAWMALRGAGMALVDISDPDDPVVLERYAALDDVRALALGPDHAWVADGDVLHGMRLDNARWTARHSVVGASAVSTWSAGWSEPTVGAEALCFVEAGSCEITSFDPVNRTVDVDWTLPAAAGDFEIAVVIGHSTTHAILRDRITTVP